MKKLLISLFAFLAVAFPIYAKDNKATLINYQGTKAVVISGSSAANWYFKLGYNVFSNKLGATVYQTPALFESSLASAINNSVTSATLVSGTTRDGTTLSGNYCFTIDSGLNTAEYVCGVASSTALTSLQRGIGSDGVTSYAGLKYAHRYGADVKVTDFPVLQQFGRIINGTDSFPNVLKYDNSVTTFTNDQQIISKKYADGIAYGSAPVAQEGTKGIVDLATQAQMSSGSYSGVGGSQLVLQSKYSSSTSPVASTIVVTKSNGKIDPSFVNGTEVYTFNGNNIFNGTSALVGKATVSTSTPTAAGQVVGLDNNSKLPPIDGSQLLKIQTNWKNGVSTKDLADSSGATTTIAHGLGRIPQRVRIFGGNAGGTSLLYFSDGSYNGSTTAMVVLIGGNPGSSASHTDTIAQFFTSGDTSKYQTATITVDATNIVLTWTRTSTPTGVIPFMWEAN